MASKLCVLLSDLHIGRGNRQDNFRGNDARFAKFCDDITILASGRGAQLDVVLNGDVFDLWEIVPDDQLGLADTDKIIKGLAYPAKTPVEIQKATDITINQLDRAITAHAPFVGGMERLLRTPGVRVHYLYGNHDHAMANTRLHDPLRDMINKAAGSQVANSGNLSFDYYYQDDQLDLYAEHGDQLAESASRSPLDGGLAQAPGFYFLRFVWNRIEGRGLAENVTSPSIGDILLLILDLVGSSSTRALLAETIGCLCDYFVAFKNGIVPELAEPLIPIYHFWQRLGEPTTPSPALVAGLRAPAHALSMARHTALGLTTDGAPKSEPEYEELPGLPGYREFLNQATTVDELWNGAKSRYESNSPVFPRLDTTKTATVVMGHTHREKYLILDGRDPEWRRRYLNSGSWTLGHKLIYAWVSDHADPVKARGLRTYVAQ